MSKTEKENRINSLAVTFLERQQIIPHPLADQIIRAYKEGYNKAEKDLKLTYDDICEIMEIREDVLEMDSYENLYEEILKRFKENRLKD
jgi:hypothetical protein